MAAALLEFETLDAEQIADIMSGKPPRPPKPSGSQAPSKPSSDGGGAQGETAPTPAA
jgi:cell division protease FtsH